MMKVLGKEVVVFLKEVRVVVEGEAQCVEMGEVLEVLKESHVTGASADVGG